MKLIHPTKAMAEGHYADLAGKPFFPGLVNFFSSGPVVAMVFQGKDAIRTGRRLLGATNPADSAPGTIRGDFVRLLPAAISWKLLPVCRLLTLDVIFAMGRMVLSPPRRRSSSGSSLKRCTPGLRYDGLASPFALIELVAL